MTLPGPICRVARTAWRNGRAQQDGRAVPEETAIAFSYNRTAHAVMMATPTDLDDFAIGFSLSEAIVDRAAEIEELAIVPSEHGIELRMWIDPVRLAALDARRRQLAGPTGCGVCGLESLEQSMREPPRIRSSVQVTAQMVQNAIASLAAHQTLNQQTRAVHAAALVQPGAGIVLVREDVGRHSALDKLVGAVARAGLDAGRGFLVMTSRVSVELIQKAARMGAPILAAVSAPTALALRVAERAGITVVGIARDDGFDVFTHAHRITFGTIGHARRKSA